MFGGEAGFEKQIEGPAPFAAAERNFFGFGVGFGKRIGRVATEQAAAGGEGFRGKRGFGEGVDEAMDGDVLAMEKKSVAQGFGQGVGKGLGELGVVGPVELEQRIRREQDKLLAGPLCDVFRGAGGKVRGNAAS